jgi:hypothetical protein
VGCERPAWRFEARRLSTQGEVACVFHDIAETSAGYVADASCSSDAASGRGRLMLSFSEAAGVMLVLGGPWETPIALVY